MWMERKGTWPPSANGTDTGSQGPCAVFLTVLWFGLLAGWLELGLVLVQAATFPQIFQDALRVNRHFVWMIPVSGAMIFGIVGLLLAPVAWLRAGHEL